MKGSGPHPKGLGPHAKGSGLRAEGWGIALTLAASIIALAAQTQPPTQPPPTFRTEANYVRVDVYPTRDDRPVTDLNQDDFDVLEGGTPQKIEQFEHVVVQATAADTRVDPNTVAESRAQLATTRGRVFVIFLDIGHVSVVGSHRMRQPLTEALDRMIGADDLVAVMTPEMSPTDLTFARKATTIAGFLERHWNWGERGDAVHTPVTDPVEQMYETCYGPVDDPNSRITKVMIARRREQQTIAALHDLVVWLRGVREERKAVIFVSTGISVTGPNAALLMNDDGRQAPPAIPQVAVDPRTGKLTTLGTPASTIPSYAQCEHDRGLLADLDNRPRFVEVLDAANASNTSFYPISPAGLTPGAAAPVVGPTTLAAPMFKDSMDSLRALADSTDGLAIFETNDLARGMRRIVDDLSSYYLIGYHSSGKLDGKFHSISVRVKGSGVRVRARRGYLAFTPEAAAALSRSAAPNAAKTIPAVESEELATARAVEAAIAPLSGYTRDVPLRLQIAAGWKPGDTSSAGLWVVGELGGVATLGDAWNDGFDATVTLTTPSDATVGSGKITVPRGGRAFRVAVTPTQPLGSGEYVLRVGARAGPASIPSRETARFTIPATPDATGALFLRRGPSTGNREVPTADLRFRRNEQVRVEIPIAAGDPVTARLLDRTGKPLAIPVTAAARDDADGSRWATAQLALAPLAVGDYAIELASGDRRFISAFRVVP